MKIKAEIIKTKKLAKEFPGVTADQWKNVAVDQTILINLVGTNFGVVPDLAKQLASAEASGDVFQEIVTNIGDDRWLVLRSK